MKFLKWRKREKVASINLRAGDSIKIVYRPTYEGVSGTYKGEEKILLSENIGREMRIDEVATFDAEVEGRDAIGAVIINEIKK